MDKKPFSTLGLKSMDYLRNYMALLPLSSRVDNIVKCITKLKINFINWKEKIWLKNKVRK